MKYKRLWIAKDSDGTIIITNYKPINVAKVKDEYNFIRDIYKQKSELVETFVFNMEEIIFNQTRPMKIGEVIPLKCLTITPRY